MPINFIDETGNRHGRLVVVERHRVSAKQRVARWVCKCDCGTVIVVRGDMLRRRGTRSCGCYVSELKSARSTKHGQYRTPTHITWSSMIARCRDPKSRYWKKGITVCERWLTFENFLADMGERPPGREIDRIDNSKGYELSNCRWATLRTQARNRTTVRLTPDLVRSIHERKGNGETIREIASSLGVSRHAVWDVVNGRSWKELHPSAEARR